MLRLSCVNWWHAIDLNLACTLVIVALVTLHCPPTKIATHSTYVAQVQVAEFQSQAVRCTVSGSGFPGLARQRQLAELTGGTDPIGPQAVPLWGKAETGRLPKGTMSTGKGGAGK